MLKTTKTVYITSDKQEWASEAEAQAHEIDAIIPPNLAHSIGYSVVANKDAILTILGARRRTRSDKGTKRKAKDRALQETISRVMKSADAA